MTDDALKDFLAPVGWAQLAEEGLAPLAWWLRRQDDPAGVPADATTEARRALAWWTVQEHAAVEIADALDGADIACAFLKGTDLNLRFYPQAGLRPMVDLDVLVTEAERERALSALLEIGFRPVHEPQKGWADRAFQTRTFRDGDEVLVELHVAVDWPETLGITTEALLARRTRIGDARVPVLDALDLLLNLATHALRDVAVPARRSLVDAHLVLESAEVDWSKLVERARVWRARAALFVLLARLRRFVGTDVPEDVLGQLRVGVIPRMLSGWLARNVEPPRWLRHAIPEQTFRLAMVEGVGARTRILARYAGLRARDLRSRPAEADER